MLVLDKQQSYKRVEEDPLIRALREACRHAVRYLPYRLSPVVMGLPGLLLHLFLLVAVHTLERARWMYATGIMRDPYSLSVEIHARQLVNRAPAWLTPESGLFLLTLPLSMLYPTRQPLIHQGVLCLMVGTMIFQWIRYLQEMISQHPEIDLPWFWLPSTHRPVSNKPAARAL